MTGIYMSVIYIFPSKKPPQKKKFELRVNLGANFLGRVENCCLS